MHRKTSTATERLTAIRALIVAIASRTGVGAAQILFATLAFVRSLRVSDLRAAGQSLVRRRQVLASIAYASVLTLVIVAGTAALVHGDSPATPAVAVADAQNRLAAAERADRSSRTDLAPNDAASCRGRAGVGRRSPGVGEPDARSRDQLLLRASLGHDAHGDGFRRPIRHTDRRRWRRHDFRRRLALFGVRHIGRDRPWQRVLTHYAHASRINVVVGQPVTAGQIVAWEGSTGDSTGPHLHFEVHQGLWNQVNPAPFLRERGVLIGC